MPFADAAPKPSGTTGKSDLNRDGTVDYADLVIFSTNYLGQNAETIDWCAFYKATGLEDELYGRPPSFYLKHFSQLLNFINGTYCDRSDMNKDGLVDQVDLRFFSFKYLDNNWEAVDWCAFYVAVVSGQKFNGKMTSYYQEYFRILQGFIKDYFQCATPPLALMVEDQPKSLVRMAKGIDGSGNEIFYFTEVHVNSVFIYDKNLSLTGQIKNLSKPIGISIDTQGYLLVGNDGRKNIEIYDPADGAFLGSFGEGLVRKPTAITIGPEGNIYVTDSRNHNIHVFDPAYVSLGTIGSHGAGEAELNFPIDSVIVRKTNNTTPVYELYVADQGNKRIQIYDLEGNWLESIYFDGTDGQNCNWFTGTCEIPGLPPFIRLQALDVDSLGRLHILDTFAASVLTMDTHTGDFLDSYGEYGKGSGPGLLKNPVDIILTDSNMSLVTDNGSDEIEVFAVPGLPQ